MCASPVGRELLPEHPTPHPAHQVIDGRFVITGSFNWTRSAVLENQENVLVLDSPPIAARYKQRFEALWNAYA
jgi:cardiolipin hydrolase